VADLGEVVQRFKEFTVERTSAPFPSDPWEQLHLAVVAVFDSWNSPRAIAYREFQRIPHDLGTAASVLAMVFGNTGWDSGTGVCFSRNPATGARELYGEYLPNAQGEDVVSGARTPKPIAELANEMLDVHRQLSDFAQRLEDHFADVQDIEFTVEHGRLFVLQTRSAKRTAAAAVKTAVDMAEEGSINREEAVHRVPARPQPLPFRASTKPRSAGLSATIYSTRLNASPEPPPTRSLDTAPSRRGERDPRSA
jgi:pyruvate,orthophosphate dikinase